MKRYIVGFAALFLCLACLAGGANAGFLDKILKKGPSDEKIAAGLKEALHIGTENTVNLTGRTDGYFGNPAIKILMPEKMLKAEKTMRKLGLDRQVDEFVLSMNRAAEKAAPFARDIFWGAIKEMTFQDVRKIWKGKDTEATEYFRSKTYDKLYGAFHPQVSQAMDEVGVTRQYKALEKKIKSIPFIEVETVDIDRYVVEKALGGLFNVLGDEERKIREDPAARVTELLREIFG
ncbi:MAG: DUF4197 domain-containing protein [Bacillota bacterium]